MLTRIRSDLDLVSLETKDQEIIKKLIGKDLFVRATRQTNNNNVPLFYVVPLELLTELSDKEKIVQNSAFVTYTFLEDKERTLLPMESFVKVGIKLPDTDQLMSLHGWLVEQIDFSEEYESHALDTENGIQQGYGFYLYSEDMAKLSKLGELSSEAWLLLDNFTQIMLDHSFCQKYRVFVYAT